MVLQKGPLGTKAAYHLAKPGSWVFERTADFSRGVREEPTKLGRAYAFEIDRAADAPVPRGRQNPSSGSDAWVQPSPRCRISYCLGLTRQ